MSKDKRAMRMSATLRAELEDIARMCNDYMPHEAGDRLEVLLGYPVGDMTNRLEAPNGGEEPMGELERFRSGQPGVFAELGDTLQKLRKLDPPPRLWSGDDPDE